MDAELVNKIVQQVLAVLGADRGRVRARPQADAKLHAASAPSAPAPRPPMRKTFITAEMLLQRLSADAHKGGIELACHEFLTPNAEDLVAERHLTVRRMPGPLIGAPGALSRSALAAAKAEAPAGPPACAGPPAASQEACAAAGPGASRPIGLVIERADEKVRGAISALGYMGLCLEDWNHTDCWVRNTRAMCEAAAAGALEAGVVVLPCAAEAMVLANKIKGVRAVQGTRADSVAAALRHFNANVLIIEHAFSTFHEIREMIRVFATARASASTAQTMLRAVAELEGA